MDIYDEFPSEFFKAAELVGKKLPVTIAACEKQTMNDGKTKPILKFDEDPRALVLNVENRTALAERFGRDTRAWVGKKVTLNHQAAEAGGERLHLRSTRMYR